MLLKLIEINWKLLALNKVPLLTPLRLTALCCYGCDADAAGGWWKQPPATPENTTLFGMRELPSIGLTPFLSDFIDYQKLKRNTKFSDIAQEITIDHCRIEGLQLNMSLHMLHTSCKETEYDAHC